jgi:sorting nexin-29
LYKEARNRATTGVRRAREAQWAAEAAANVKDMKAGRWGIVHRRMRTFVRSKKKAGSDNLKDADGKLLLSSSEKLRRWCGHFSSLLHSDDPEHDCKVDLSLLPPGRTECKTPPDEPPPNLDDVRNAMKRLKPRRAAGPDGITAEMLKFAGPTLARRLHELIVEVWNTEKAPQDWKDSTIVTLFKKNDPSVCDNHRGLSLLSIPGKVYSLILLDPLKAFMEQALMECQSGFREGRGTTEQMFTLQQVLHDSWEFNIPTHTCFIDLKKAYDSVNCPALWGVLEHIGLSAKLQRLLRDLHTGTRSTVRAYGETSEPFEVNKGVRQGCILAPALFNIFLDHVLRIALDECEGGVTIYYTLDGEVTLNNRVSRSSEIEETVLALLYADDMSIVCEDSSALKRIVLRLDEVLMQWGLVISQKKTEILTVDRRGQAAAPAVRLRGKPIKSVDQFKYLGKHFTNKPTGKGRGSFFHTDIESRMKSASDAFYRLAAPLHRRKDIPLRYKLRMFKTTALPTLLYGSETWSPDRDELRRLESWQHRCIRYMMGIRYETHGHVSNSSLRQKCRLPKLENVLRKKRLRWFGHAARMDSSRLPRKMLTAHLGKNRPHGRPHKSWRQAIAEDLNFIGCYKTYPEAVQNRDRWRERVNRPQAQSSTRPRRSMRRRA